MPIMRIIPGKIVAGPAVLKGDRLAEGENLHVLANGDENNTLTPEREAEVADRIAAMDRGEFAEYESAETFIRALRARRCAAPR